MEIANASLGGLSFQPACEALIYIGGVSKAAQLLGFSPDSKLLIIHADDLGLCHSVNRATFIALEEGTVSSASLMVPCPAFAEVAEVAARHSEYDLGIHSTLISEHQDYKWGPVSKKHHGPELVDANGHFWPTNTLLRASADEIADEISAQVTLAKESGINITHLDSHTFSVARAGYIPAYIQTARRFGLPFLITEHWHSYCPADDPERMEDIIVDDVFQAPRDLSLSSLEDFYLSILREVRPGISQLIVHPAFDDPEMRAIYKEREAYGAAWRQCDFEVMRSQRFRSALRENGIQVIDWGMIQSAISQPGRPPARNARL
jgi:chitin disaccharide deacetylase